MGQEIEGLKLLLLLGEDQAATPGYRLCVQASTKCWEQGSGVKLRVRGRPLDRKIFFQLSPTAACFVCGMALQDKVLIYCILFVPNQG